MNEKVYEEGAVQVVDQMDGQEAKAIMKDQQALSNVINVSEMVGKIKLALATKDLFESGLAVWLFKIKTEKLYKSLPGSPNWEGFCKDIIGVSRSHVDDQLLNYKSLGETAIDRFREIGLGHREIKQIRQDDDIQIEGDLLIYGDHQIEMKGENAEAIKELLQTLREEQDNRIRERDVIIEEKDTKLEAKEALAKKAREECAELRERMEEDNARAKARGFESDSEEYALKRLESIRLEFDGMLLEIRPANHKIISESSTDRARASYLSTLDYIARRAKGIYDQAVEVHGDPDLDMEWRPGMADEMEVDWDTGAAEPETDGPDPDGVIPMKG